MGETLLWFLTSSPCIPSGDAKGLPSIFTTPLTIALGEGLPIEQVNVFLKAVRAKLSSRAQRDGVRVCH
eukprot:1750990-Amphidinium_carterae.1